MAEKVKIIVLKSRNKRLRGMRKFITEHIDELDCLFTEKEQDKLNKIKARRSSVC